jgi:hypothetical protein
MRGGDESETFIGLTTDERIESLTRELSVLQQKRRGDNRQPATRPYILMPLRRLNPAPVETPAAPAAAAAQPPPAPAPVVAPTPPVILAPTPAPAIAIVPTVEPQLAPVVQPTVTDTTIDEDPIHPFARENYEPPSERNVAAPQSKKISPAYRNVAPIQDGKVAEAVYRRAMATEITVTQEELLSLSPEVRNQMKDAISSKHQPNTTINANTFDEALPFASEDDGRENEVEDEIVSELVNLGLPEDAIIVPDPYEVYALSLGPGVEPEPLQVAGPRPLEDCRRDQARPFPLP